MKKSGGLFGGMFGGGNDKIEDAAEKFTRAANGYKAVKKCAFSREGSGGASPGARARDPHAPPPHPPPRHPTTTAGMEAGKAFRRAAECYVKIKDEHGAATAYIEAARAYIKGGDGKTGTEVLENEALPRIVDAGRLSQAAKLHGEVAELFEDEGLTPEAISHFQSAADLHYAENANSTALKSLTRIAHLSAQLDPPDLEKAAETFEKVATESLSSNLLKFGAKSAFFNAALCTLARGDVVAGEQALEKYKELDYTFPGCRECKLLEDVTQAFKDLNVEAFTDAVYNCAEGGGDLRLFSYSPPQCLLTHPPPIVDQISKIDPWRTTLLLKIKTSIQKSGGGGGGGEVDLM